MGVWEKGRWTSSREFSTFFAPSQSRLADWERQQLSNTLLDHPTPPPKPLHLPFPAPSLPLSARRFLVAHPRRSQEREPRRLTGPALPFVPQIQSLSTHPKLRGEVEREGIALMSGRGRGGEEVRWSRRGSAD